MSSWYDLSKFKETMSAAAAQLQTQASVTAKQYIQTYNPDEHESDEDVQPVPNATITKHPESSSCIPQPASPTQNKSPPTTSAEVQQKVQQQESLANFFNVFGKQALPAVESNQSPQQDTQQGQIAHLQTLLLEERSFNANLESKLSDNNRILDEMTKTLHKVSFIMTRAPQQSEDDIDSVYSLKIEIERASQLLEDEKLNSEKALKELKASLEKKFIIDLAQANEEFKAQLTARRLAHQESLQSLKIQNEQAIAQSSKEHQRFQSEAEVYHKRQTVKYVHAAFTQTLQNSGAQETLNPDQSLSQLTQDFQTIIQSEVLGKTDDQLINQLQTVWQSSSEMFKDTDQYLKKARSDSQNWLTQRHQFDQSSRTKNAQLLRLFSTQLALLFQLQSQLSSKDQETQQHREVRETLQTQLQRLQRDINQSSQSGLKIGELQSKITQLELQVQTQQTKVKDSLASKLAYELRMQEQSDKLTQLITENVTLKDKITDQDIVSKSMQTEMSKQKQLQAINEELRENVKLQQQTIAQLRQQLQRRDQENLQQTQTITNLQRSMQRLQEDLDSMSDEHRQKIRDLQTQITSNQAQLDRANQSNLQVSKMEENLKMQEMQKVQLCEQLQQTMSMNEELREQIDKLNKSSAQDGEIKEYLIDRRLINNQLVKCLSPKSTYATKQGILQAMSQMLKFTDLEMKELGLKVDQQPRMRESFYSFLLGDSDL